MKVYMRYVLSAVLLLLWLGVIWMFSAQNGEQSAAVSDSIAMEVPGVDFKADDPEDPVSHALTTVIRKGAHMFEYAVLFCLFLFFCHVWMKGSMALINGVAFASSVFCAEMDELHQFFVPGRDCRVTDILIDVAGIVIAFLLVRLIRYRRRNRIPE